MSWKRSCMNWLPPNAVRAVAGLQSTVLDLQLAFCSEEAVQVIHSLLCGLVGGSWI